MTNELNRRQVVVIGGGLAGAACTIELGRAGVDAVAFDRDQFPRRKVCGEFLSPGALRCLDALDVLGQVQSRGAVRVERARIRLGDRVIEIPFEEPGLGFSRECLDQILAARAGVRAQHPVERVERFEDGFRVHGARPDGDDFWLDCDVVIDAAGKLSRFTPRRGSGQFGVQFYEERPTDSTLEFCFFDGGYGGSVSVEGGRTNTCYLVDKIRVGEYIGREGCIVTGSVGYSRVGGPYLAVGDAGGMIDPFCGEGMRHALESGRLAARIVIGGLVQGLSYRAIREHYEFEWGERWGRKRTLASILRWTFDHRLPKHVAFALGAGFPGLETRLLDQLWK